MAILLTLNNALPLSPDFRWETLVLLRKGGLYMGPRARREGRVGLLTEEWFTIPTPVLLDTKYQNRLPVSVMLLKAKLTNLEDRRRCRQLMHCSLLAYDLLSVPRGAQERPTVWIEQNSVFFLLHLHISRSIIRHTSVAQLAGVQQCIAAEARLYGKSIRMDHICLLLHETQSMQPHS